MARTPDAALSGSDITNANMGATSVQVYYDVVASTVVATALINQASFTYPLTQLTVDNTSADWTNVAVGMDVWVGSSAGLSDIGIYYVRGVTATVLGIGEMAEGDPGLITSGIRTTGFADNQYITIIDRRSVWSVLPRIVDPNIYEDYDRLMSPSSGFNVHPPPVVSVLCSSAYTTQYNHIWSFVDDNQTYATITFTASSDRWPTEASETYAWTAPASWTVMSGSVATNTFTARVPSASSNYVLTLNVTSNGGGVQHRRVNVWVKTRSGANAPTTMDALDGISITETGVSLSFGLNDTRLTNIPDGAMVVVVLDALFNGARIATAATQFVGWIARISKITEPGLKSASVNFISPGALLEFKRGTSQIFTVNASADTWQKLPASLMSLSFAMFWLLSQRARGILELFDFVPYSTSATGQRLPALELAIGPLWQQLVDLADGIAKREIGCDPDGTLWVMPNPSLLAYPRSSTVKRDTLTGSLYHDLEWGREMYDKVGLIEGSAFTWDGSATLPTPLLSIAPGLTPGQGSGNVKLEKQVVASQSDLNTLTGMYLRFLNPDYPDVTINIEGNRGLLHKPAQRQMVRLQATAAQTPDGVTLDRYIIPREVRLSFIEGGVVNTSISGPFETAGVAGITKNVPAANDNIYGGQTIITPPVTNPNITATHDGNSWIVLTDSHVAITVNSGTNYTNITGTGLSGLMWDLKLDPYSDWLSIAQSGNLAAWCLTATGLYYTTNILNTSPTWVLKNALAPGVSHGHIRPSINEQGVVYVAWVNDSGGSFASQVYAARFTNYGTTIAHSNTLGTATNGYGSIGFDIDLYGSDEMLVGAHSSSVGAISVYRISSGTASRITTTDVASNVILSFLQKPILKFGGGANSNTGASEHFLYSYMTGGNVKLVYTTDGGATQTDITPAVLTNPMPAPYNSAIATDNSDVIAFMTDAGQIYTTINRGGAWTSRGTDANLGRTLGLFPRQISGNYGLYMAGATKVKRSLDFGATITDVTGDLATAIGGSPAFINIVLPLY